MVLAELAVPATAPSPILLATVVPATAPSLILLATVVPAAPSPPFVMHKGTSPSTCINFPRPPPAIIVVRSVLRGSLVAADCCELRGL